jgi:hypothetical protein
MKTIGFIGFLFLTAPFLRCQSLPVDHFLSDEISSFSTSPAPHLLTIFVIPSRVEYDWSSPKSLYKSFFKNFKRNIFTKEPYLLGHAFIDLISPLAQDRIFTGMKAASKDEQKALVMDQDYGLSILGADLTGKLETSNDLEKRVEYYSRKGRLAFMTILINDEAAQRMVEFYNLFIAEGDSLQRPDHHYGGAYWPRYYGEGAGCSAFAVSFLDLGGLLEDEYEEWQVQVDIPMDLIGGPYNEGNRVDIKEIKKCDHWADEACRDAMGFVPFEIYDPTLIFKWINDLWADPTTMPDLVVKPVEIGKAKGVLIDCREVPAPVDESIFMERKKRSVFVGSPQGW